MGSRCLREGSIPRGGLTRAGGQHLGDLEDFGRVVGCRAHNDSLLAGSFGEVSGAPGNLLRRRSHLLRCRSDLLRHRRRLGRGTLMVSTSSRNWNIIVRSPSVR